MKQQNIELQNIELQRKIEKLESLIEVSKLVTSSLDLSSILEQFRRSAKENLKAKFCTIYLIDEKKNEIYSVAIDDSRIDKIVLPIGKGVAGKVAEKGTRIITNNAYSDKRFDDEIDKQIGGHTDNLCTVSMKNYEGKIIGVIQLMNKEGGFSDEDAKFLEALAVPAAIAVDNAKLHKIEMENKDLMREMELASKVQKMLLPDKFPSIDYLKTWVIYKPYYKVSGDIYDFVKFNDNSIGLAIGDVSGKGVSAALIMSTIKTLFTSLSSDMPTTSKMCELLNNNICRLTKGKRFCTFFYCIIDIKRNKIVYTNAGHNPPILLKSNGDIFPLKGGGAVIGAIENTEYEQLETNFDVDDYILLYTDGVTESRNPEDEMYSDDRLVKAILKGRNIEDERLAYYIEQDLINFMKDEEQQADDYTIISMKYSSDSEAKEK